MDYTLGLTNKKALVTRASKDIGRSALALAKQGADVVVVARSRRSRFIFSLRDGGNELGRYVEN
jgi:NAD(P)-dependent dehydrogenase (short-subunit alcohol dehydrogenase family)